MTNGAKASSRRRLHLRRVGSIASRRFPPWKFPGRTLPSSTLARNSRSTSTPRTRRLASRSAIGVDVPSRSVPSGSVAVSISCTRRSWIAIWSIGLLPFLRSGPSPMTCRPKRASVFIPSLQLFPSMARTRSPERSVSGVRQRMGNWIDKGTVLRQHRQGHSRRSPSDAMRNYAPGFTSANKALGLMAHLVLADACREADRARHLMGCAPARHVLGRPLAESVA